MGKSLSMKETQLERKKTALRTKSEAMKKNAKECNGHTTTIPFVVKYTQISFGFSRSARFTICLETDFPCYFRYVLLYVLVPHLRVFRLCDCQYPSHSLSSPFSMKWFVSSFYLFRIALKTRMLNGYRTGGTLIRILSVSIGKSGVKQ